MKDFSQRGSLRDSMINYEKMEIFDPWIRKLSGNEIFGGFIFARIFSLAEPGDVAKRWHKNLEQNWL